MGSVVGFNRVPITVIEAYNEFISDLFVYIGKVEHLYLKSIEDVMEFIDTAKKYGFTPPHKMDVTNDGKIVLIWKLDGKVFEAKFRGDSIFDVSITDHEFTYSSFFNNNEFELFQDYFLEILSQ